MSGNIENMQDNAPPAGAAGPDPHRVHSAADLVRELDLLRRRAAGGSRRTRVSLDRIAAETGIPRSTVHSYVSGGRLPPADSLDGIVISLGATAAEQREWAEALYRAVSDERDVQQRPNAQVPRQLPAAPRDFTGRDAEMRRLHELVEATAEQAVAPLVIAVTGTGGVGKTALALRWAHDVAPGFPDGQLWADLRGFSPSPAHDPSDVLEQLLRAVGVSTKDLPADVEVRAGLFRSAVAGRRMLLVLDNAHDGAQVLPLLPGTPGFVTVVTSRDALRSLVAGAGAARVQVDRLAPASAMSLLAAPLPQPIAGTATLARIARHCDGLPLALRIVRERLSVATADDVEEFAADLDRDRQSRLEVLDLNDMAVDVSVRGALRWSYRELPPATATLFRRLPLCLVTTFDASCAAAVLDADLPRARRLLDSLICANLLDAAGPDQYRLHDLVVTFAAECLNADEHPDEIAQARARLFGHLAGHAQAAVELWETPRPTWLPYPDNLPGIEHAAVLPFTTTHAARDWVTTHAELITAAMIDAARNGPIEYSWLLGEHGARSVWLFADAGRLEHAMHVACRTAEDAGNPAAATQMARQLGIVYGRRCQLAEAERMFAHATDLARACGDDSRCVGGAGVDMGNLAIVWSMQGQLPRAIEAIIGAIADIRSAGTSPLSSLLSLVEFELQRGGVDAADEWLREVLLEPGGGRGAHGMNRFDALLLAARIALERGQVSAARTELLAAEDEMRASLDRENLIRLLTLRASVQRDAHELPDAERTARKASVIARDVGATYGVPALCVLGDVTRALGNPAEAVAVLDRALNQARAAGLRYAQAEALVLYAAALRDAGDRADALSAALEAERIAADCGYDRLLQRARTQIDAVADAERA